MKNYILVAVLTMAFVVSSCQSFKKKESPAEGSAASSLVGQWEAKAMIKSLETGEASVVTLDVIAQKPSPMRVEVSTSLGIALASVILKDEKIEYVVPKQKKYFQGPVNMNSLEPILKVKVDPRLFVAAFFEEAYPQWSCKADEGLLSSCSTPEGVEVKWNREDSGSTHISFSSSEFDVQVQIKKYTAKAEMPKSALVLKVPSHFRKYELK